jgi:hypothetical protein
MHPPPDTGPGHSSVIQSIYVDTFTPILGRLLLSSNAIVARAARFAVVDVLSRIREADQLEDSLASEVDSPPFIGSFSRQGRRLLENEFLHRIVIGIGRLEDRDEVYHAPTEEVLGPEPAAPVPLDAPSHPLTGTRRDDLPREAGHVPSDSASGSGVPRRRSRVHLAEGEDGIHGDTEAGEQAAIGRLSCMSLIAAVTASTNGLCPCLFSPKSLYCSLTSWSISAFVTSMPFCFDTLQLHG